MADVKMEEDHFSPYRADGKLVSCALSLEEGKERLIGVVWLCMCGYGRAAASWTGYHSGIGWYVEFVLSLSLGR
jgi:hypothetical protein